MRPNNSGFVSCDGGKKKTHAAIRTRSNRSTELQAKKKQQKAYKIEENKEIKMKNKRIDDQKEIKIRKTIDDFLFFRAQTFLTKEFLN